MTYDINGNSVDRDALFEEKNKGMPVEVYKPLHVQLQEQLDHHQKKVTMERKGISKTCAKRVEKEHKKRVEKAFKKRTHEPINWSDPKFVASYRAGLKTMEQVIAESAERDRLEAKEAKKGKNAQKARKATTKQSQATPPAKKPPSAAPPAPKKPVVTFTWD